MKVSDDFVIPDTPAPSWQIVDSKGNTYLLNQFRIKGDKTNREITLPGYIKDVAKVQVWCSFAEVLLGETTFDSDRQVNSRVAESRVGRYPADRRLHRTGLTRLRDSRSDSMTKLRILAAALLIGGLSTAAQAQVAEHKGLTSRARRTSSPPR